MRKRVFFPVKAEEHGPNFGFWEWALPIMLRESRHEVLLVPISALCERHFLLPSCREKRALYQTSKVVQPWGIHFGLFGVQETHFLKMNFHFVNKPHFLFLHTEKREPYIRPQRWMATKVVQPWGIPIGPFGVQETHFCKMDFHFVDKPHGAFPFSCMQRKGNPKVGYFWTMGVPPILHLHLHLPL